MSLKMFFKMLKGKPIVFVRKILLVSLIHWKILIAEIIIIPVAENG
jgi:hypothetical protein